MIVVAVKGGSDPLVTDRLTQLAVFATDQVNTVLPLLVSVYVWLEGLNGPPLMPVAMRFVAGVTASEAVPRTVVRIVDALLVTFGSGRMFGSVGDP